MAIWLNTIDLKSVWANDFRRIAAVLIEDLKNIPSVNPELDSQKQDLVEELESLQVDEEATVRDFDSVLSRVYDWGDTPLDNSWNGKKMCWIATAF